MNTRLIVIDNLRADEWDLTLSERYLFGFLHRSKEWAEKVSKDRNGIWYFVSRTVVIAQIPCLTNKADTVYRLYKSLEKKGVLCYAKDGKKDCIQFTKMGERWKQKRGTKSDKTRNQIRENSEMNPRKLGMKSEKTRNEIRENSDLNPTYKEEYNKGEYNKEREDKKNTHSQKKMSEKKSKSKSEQANSKKLRQKRKNQMLIDDSNLEEEINLAKMDESWIRIKINFFKTFVGVEMEKAEFQEWIEKFYLMQAGNGKTWPKTSELRGNIVNWIKLELPKKQKTNGRSKINSKFNSATKREGGANEHSSTKFGRANADDLTNWVTG